MNISVLFLTELDAYDEWFIINHTNILACDRNDKGIYGVANFVYTYSLVNSIEMSINDYAHSDGYCYPKDEFSLEDMIAMLRVWDGKSDPPTGWMRYEGSKGECTPEEYKLQSLKRVKEG